MVRRTVHLLEPPGSRRKALVESLPDGLEVLDGLEAFRALPPPPSGVLLLGPGLPAAEVLEALEEWGMPGSGWLTVRVLDGEDGSELRPLSLSFPARGADLAARARGETPEEPVMDLESLLHTFSRVRHDMNNPLTSALAETQLLLLDAEEGEERTSLLSIERQLGRIRDMIKDLARFRPRPRDEG